MKLATGAWAILSILLITISGCNSGNASSTADSKQPPNKPSATSSSVGSNSKQFSFEPDSGTRVARGVSTFAFRQPNGEILLYDTSRGISIYRSKNGLDFTNTGKTVRPGFDPSVIALPQGKLRMYVADIVGGHPMPNPANGQNGQPPTSSQPPPPPGGAPTPGQPPIPGQGHPPRPGQAPPPPGPQSTQPSKGRPPMQSPQNQKKRLLSLTSNDGLVWKQEPGVRMADVGFGVPVVVPIADGKWRLYWCSKAKSGKTQIKAADSTDGGLKFKTVSLSGIPATYVDPSVVQLHDGSWLGLFSTNPGERRSNDPQQIYVGTSKDGLRWELEKKPLIAIKDTMALDPTLLKLSDSKYRVYYSSAYREQPKPGQPPANTGDTASVKSGVITIR